MQQEDCFLIGTIFKLHGFKGKIKVYNNEDIIINLDCLKYLFIKINGILIPFFIENAKTDINNNFIVKIENINSEYQAKEFVNKEVFIRNEDNSLKNKENIIGFSEIDIEKGYLGKISNINKKTSQHIIYVRQKNQNEFCFPLHENFIKNIDNKKNILEVIISEEMINLNKK